MGGSGSPETGGAHLTLSVSSLLSAGLAPGLIRHHGARAALPSGGDRRPGRQRRPPVPLHPLPLWNQHSL